MNDDNMRDPQRKQRAENFQVNIPENRTPRENLNSFSAPGGSGSPDPFQAEKTSAKNASRAHKSRNRRKRLGNRWFFRIVWLVVVLLVGMTIGNYCVTGINDMLAVGREKLEVTVEIPQGATTEIVAGKLLEVGAIERTDFFQLYSKITKSDGKFNYGTYKVDTDMDYEALINTLQSTTNRVDVVKITFQEGVNAMEIAQLLEDNGVCSNEDATAILKGMEFDTIFDFIGAIQNGSDRYYKLEGYLFPDTYEFFLNEDPKTAIKKLINNCDNKLDDDVRKAVETSGMSIDQVMTLASMIQAEAASTEDMYNISSVFHNRLSGKGEPGLQRLQSDPTMYYPYRTKAKIPESLRETYTSTYNTYNIDGLPAGPICNPGAKAIDAALHPNDTKYYYFCHSAEGKAYYARTYREHQNNLVKAGLR